MNSLQQRADYLLCLMPRLKKSIEERLPMPGCLMTSQLTLSQLHIMQYLLRHGLAAMSDIAKWGQVAMPTMTESVNRLVRQQFVERVRDPHDRRIVRIRVTLQGKKEFKKCSLHARQRFIGILKTMNAVDQKRMLQALQTLETILNKKQPSYPGR